MPIVDSNIFTNFSLAVVGHEKRQELARYAAQRQPRRLGRGRGRVEGHEEGAAGSAWSGVAMCLNGQIFVVINFKILLGNLESL